MDSFAQSLRPSHNQGSTFTKTAGHPLDEAALQTAFTATAASPPRPSSRSSSRPLSAGGKVAVRGPERFFYDTKSYTGTHAKGGPDAKERQTFQDGLCEEHYRGSTFTRTGGHPLDYDAPRDKGLGAGEGRHKFQDDLRQGHHRGSTFMCSGGHSLDRDAVRERGLGAGPCDVLSSTSSSFSEQVATPSGSTSRSRHNSQSPNSQHSGVERFFYDKKTYTGTHAVGRSQSSAPAVTDLRSGHHKGNTFTKTGGNPLDYDRVRSSGLGGGACDHAAAFALRPETNCGSSYIHTSGHPLDDSSTKPLSSSLLTPGRIRSSSRGSSNSRASSCSGPERFFYDQNSYTGCHRSSVSSNASTEADFVDTLRPGHHTTSSRVRVDGHPLHGSALKHIDSLAPTECPRQERRRPSVSGSSCVAKGPERFFYDKSSYTGVHKNGGPSTIG